ncbi:MAG: ferritin family protein [Thermodesulfobacteriota bacterium]|nr:ferritin family protein [Thermodesulfobacteriota bacterium]
MRFLNLLLHHPKTISVLEAAYNGEIQAFHSYMAYAGNANSDNYINIVKLFVALAASEAIHAHNFKTLLSELGVEVTGPREIQIEASVTKENLNKTTKVELQEIDTKYPQFIKKIQ